jgi:hypothetical protein
LCKVGVYDSSQRNNLILSRTARSETLFRKIARLTSSRQVRRIDHNDCMALCMLHESRLRNLAVG